MINTDFYHRTFLALVPPSDICQKLIKEIHRVKTSAKLAEVKWYQIEKLHITLQFLGKASVTQVNNLATQLKEIIKQQPPFLVSLEDIVVFPSLRHPKVIAFELAESEELSSLTSSIEQSTSLCELREPDFAFNGHLTLGKLPRVKPRFERRYIATPNQDLTWIAREMYLMESVFEDGHSHYVKLAEFKFFTG